MLYMGTESLIFLSYIVNMFFEILCTFCSLNKNSAPRIMSRLFSWLEMIIVVQHILGWWSVGYNWKFVCVMPCTASSESPVAVEIVMLNGLYVKFIFSAIEVCNIVFEHPVSMRHLIFNVDGGIVTYMNDNSAPILVALS